MEEESVPLLSQSNNSPPLVTRASAHLQHELPCDQQLPPPYQPTTMSPKYAFEANYIKATVGDSPTFKFTVTSEPPLTPNTEYSLTHYEGNIATKRFKVQHDAIEFHEVRVSDTGFYTIRCTNGAGLEGEETIELEVFKKKFSALFKKAAANKPTTNRRIVPVDSIDPEEQLPHQMTLSSVEVPEDPSSSSNQELVIDNAAVHQSDEQQALAEPPMETIRTLTVRNGEDDIIAELPGKGIVKEEMKESALNIIGHSEVESIEEQDESIKYKKYLHLLLLFKILSVIFVWSIPCFIGIIVFLRKAIHESEAGMKQRAQINFRIAQCFLGAWITSNVLGIVIITLTVIAISL